MMAILKLEDLAKVQLAKDVKEDVKYNEIEVKRLGFSIKVKNLDDYEMYDSVKKGEGADSLDSAKEANAEIIKFGCVEPNFKDEKVRIALGSSSPVGAIINLFTAGEIAEIAATIVEFSKRDKTISVKERVEGL